MVMSERFEVYKYNGGKKEKKNRTEIVGKKREGIQFWRGYA